MNSQPSDLTKEVAAELSGILHMGSDTKEYWTWYPNADMAQLEPRQVIYEQNRWFCNDERRKDCQGKNKCFIWGSLRGLQMCRKICLKCEYTFTEVRDG